MTKDKFLKYLISATICSSLLLSSVGCGSKKTENISVKPPKNVSELIKLAKEEGNVVSVGMPDTWVDWKDTWDGIKSEYGISHIDTDMSSSEEISKFEVEKNKPTADIGDVGMTFGPVAVSKGLTLPYKTSYFDEIPNWAKDKDGNWIVAYTGTIAIITNKKLVKNPPKSWNDLLKGNYKVAIDDVTKSAQGQATVLAAAMAYGGNEKNIQPGLDIFANLAKQGRLSLVNPSLASLEKGEVAVALLWDFSALSRRDKIDKNSFDVCIPREGSLTSGYTTIINKYAPHPYAAMLTREYILSDKGQINIAKGYARPIRSSVKLPADIKTKMLPDEQYKNAKPISDFNAWEETAKQLPELWQEQVLVNIK